MKERVRWFLIIGLLMLPSLLLSGGWTYVYGQMDPLVYGQVDPSGQRRLFLPAEEWLLHQDQKDGLAQVVT